MKAIRKFLMFNLACLLIIISIVISFQLIYSYPMVNAAKQIDRYWSGLTVDHQIPPANTDARGYVGLKFDDDLGVFAFTVNAENIGNVIGIYVYKRLTFNLIYVDVFDLVRLEIGPFA